jgi:hypothetical protein
MKLYLARVTDQYGGGNGVWVFATAKKRREFIAAYQDSGRYIEIEKETCDFPATKEGIVEFFNENAWHWQYGDPE